MEDKEERKLFNSIKNTFVGWIVTFFLTSSVGLTVFYFNTTHVQAQNTKKIEKLEKINGTPELNSLKINQLAKEFYEFKQDAKDNHKEDKADAKEMRKELMAIKELLYQIKRQNN